MATPSMMKNGTFVHIESSEGFSNSDFDPLQALRTLDHYLNNILNGCSIPG